MIASDYGSLDVVGGFCAFIAKRAIPDFNEK